ncbi:tail fiber domain-containing protein [Anaerosporobacter sp.]
MLNITTELKDLYKTDYLPYRSEPVQKDLKFTFTDPVLVIDNKQVVAGSFDLQESLNSSEDLVFGSCEAACLKVKFADITEELKGKTFTLTQTVNGTIINLGIFTVDSAIEQDSRRFLEVTAYDNMRKFDKDVVEWYESLTFPLTLKAMRESLCGNCGVEFEDSDLPNDGMTVTKTISNNTLNGLEVLRSIEQLNGALGHIGRDGKLQHKILSKTVVDDTIPSGSYKTLKYEKYSTKPIDKLQILQEDGDIGAIVGTGTNCYQIQDNFLVYGKSASALQTIADNAATNILGITYIPYTCDMLGLPYLEVGDRLTYGNVITSYILGRNMKGIQAITDSTEAIGNEEIVQVTSINTEVKQLRGKTNVLSRDVEKMESTITEFDKQISVLLPGPWYPDGSLFPCLNNMTNLEYEINSRITQTAKEITTEVNNVSEQLNTQINQTATSITAQVNNLSANMNAQFAITDAEISTKVEKNGIISSINQSAESITINASKINLTGYATFSGLSDGTTVINGGCIKTGTIDSVHINSATITSSMIGDCLGIDTRSIIVSSTYGDVYNEVNVVNGVIQLTRGSVTSYINPYSITLNGRSVMCYGDSAKSVATGYLTLSSGTLTADTGSLWIGQNTVKAETITQTSSRKCKKNITKFKKSALDIINVSDIKEFRYKHEDRKHKKHVGVIVEESNDIIVNDERNAVDLGAMTTLSWKAIQELGEELRQCKELIQQYCN